MKSVDISGDVSKALEQVELWNELLSHLLISVSLISLLYNQGSSWGAVIGCLVGSVDACALKNRILAQLDVCVVQGSYV